MRHTTPGDSENVNEGAERLKDVAVQRFRVSVDGLLTVLQRAWGTASKELRLKRVS
jgi:hypothetical protein